MQDQGQHAVEEGRPVIDVQIVRDDVIGWTIQPLLVKARAMASKEVKLASQAREEFRIVAGYVEAVAFSRYLAPRGFSVRSRAD